MRASQGAASSVLLWTISSRASAASQHARLRRLKRAWRCSLRWHLGVVLSSRRLMLCFALEALDWAIRKEFSDLCLSRATHTLAQKSEGPVWSDPERVGRTPSAAASFVELSSARQRLEVGWLARPAPAVLEQ